MKGEKILEYELISTTNGKKFRLDGTFFTIGRGKDCDVYLNLPTVSRKHVELTFTDGKWKMTNFSSNGVYVNSRQYMKEKILKNGDILDIGGAKIKFAERE